MLLDSMNFQMMKVFYLNVVAVDNIVIREEKNAKQDSDASVIFPDKQEGVFSWIPSIRGENDQKTEQRKHFSEK